VHNIFIKVVTLAWLLQGGLWISATLRVLLEYYQQEQESKDPAGASMINVLGLLGRILLWSLVLLLALDNLGVNITALVTGLGIGGIAIALAVQTVLSDLLASLSIVLDKPFTLGDFLIIGEHMGSVEYIGLKTTRIRSLSGEQLVFSNADLLQSRIRNFGRMFERRVVFKIGVTYQTPRERLTEIPGIIRAAIESQDKTRFDRSHFVSYGDFSLVFETVYYVLGADYNLYMDIQQAINLYIHERFEEQNIDFAYPTQTVFLQRVQQQQSAPA
jgi:small-conductance mechanosensitive channel